MVRVPFTAVKSRLREAIRGLTPRQTSTDFAEAVALIRALSQGLADAHLYLFSDGAFEIDRVPQNLDVELHYVKVGAASANVGITAIDARRSPEGWDEPQVFVRAENFGPLTAQTRIDLFLDGKLFDARALEIPAGGKAGAVFTGAQLTQGVVKAVLSPEDDLAVDNEAHLVLVEPREVRMLLVTASNYFLELAVQRDRAVAPVFMTPKAFDASLGAGTFAPTDYDVVLFDRHRPDTLPPGTYVFIGAAPPIEGFSVTGELTDPVVIDWDTLHPVNRYVSFSNLYASRALQIEAPRDAHPLVESDAGPLVLWWSSGRYRVLVVAFDLFQTRWPLRLGFPIFMANVVRYLGGVASSGAALSVRPGESIHFAVPAGVDQVRVTAPGGSAVAPVRSGRVAFGDTTRCGPYVFDIDKQRQVTYVVNLADARESDLAPLETITWSKREVTATAKALKENREFWLWPALLALGLVMLEWYVYNRRVYI